MGVLAHISCANTTYALGYWLKIDLSLLLSSFWENLVKAKTQIWMLTNFWSVMQQEKDVFIFLT
jgi:hypothetical protein